MGCDEGLEERVRTRMAGRLGVAIALLWVLGAGGGARAGEESVLLKPHWKAGEKLHYELVKTREKRVKGRPAMKYSSRTGIDIEVLSVADDGIVLKWTWGAVEFDDPFHLLSPQVRKTANLFSGVPIILELDSKAAIKGVRNWEELKVISAKVIDAMVAQTTAEGLDAANADRLRTQLQAAFSSKEMIVQNCTREAGMFFMTHGIELHPGKPLERQAYLPNPLGGEPFPARIRVALVGMVTARNLARVSYQQTIADEDARRIMKKTVAALTARTGKPFPNAAEIESLTIADEADFYVEMSSGWVESFNHRRTVKTDGGTQTDSVAVSRKKT